MELLEITLEESEAADPGDPRDARLDLSEILEPRILLALDSLLYDVPHFDGYVEEKASRGQKHQDEAGIPAGLAVPRMAKQRGRLRPQQRQPPLDARPQHGHDPCFHLHPSRAKETIYQMEIAEN